MLIALDENIPKQVGGILNAFMSSRYAKRKYGDCEFKSSRDYTDLSLGKSDDVWIKKFILSGGQIIITADKRIFRNPHERVVILESGIFLVLIDAGRHQSIHTICAAVIKYWPNIIQQFKANKKSVLIVRDPFSPDDHTKVTPLNSPIKYEDVRPSKKKVAKKPKKPVNDTVHQYKLL